MPVRPSVARRSVLRAAAAGATVLLLPGCALAPVDGPSPAPPPSAPLLPGQEALLDLRRALVRARATAWPDAGADLLTWALDVTADQLRAVSLPGPTPAPAPLPTAALSPDPSGLSALLAALGAAGGAFRAQAVDPSSAHPHLWASMSAWAAVVADQLPAPTAAREPARGVLDPAPQSPDAAVQAAVDAAAQAAWGLETAAGAPGLVEDERDALRVRIAAWQGLRETLLAQAGPTASPTPPPPWYAVRRPATAADARELAARIGAAALPVLGRSTSFAPPGLRGVLVTALVDAAVDVPAWGGLAERWPGLPRS